MDKKYKILALFGKSGAGKDNILNYLVLKYPTIVNKVISYTTRPKRKNEIDGVDYIFVNEEEFFNNLRNESIPDTAKFNNWLYGMNVKCLKYDELNIGVFDIKRIEYLFRDPRFDILPVYITCSDKIRLQRCLNRGDNVDCHGICRRFLADEKDFENIDFDFDFVLFDNAYNADRINILNVPDIHNFVKDFIEG